MILRVLACLFAYGALCGWAYADNNNSALKPVIGAAQASPSNDFFAVGLSSVWERPSSLWDFIGEGEQFECTDFFVHAIPDAPSEVEITTSGIGDARLLDLAQPHGQCPENGSPGSRLISISKPGGEDHELRLIVPGQSFPDFPQGDQGDIVFLVPNQAPIDVSLTLVRQGVSPAWQAPVWILSIGVPAILTAWIGFIFARWQKRLDMRQQNQIDLATFKKNHAQSLREFFETYYHNIISVNEPNKPGIMRRELTEKGILGALPTELGNKASEAIDKSDWEKLSGTLATAFPDWQMLILKK